MGYRKLVYTAILYANEIKYIYARVAFSNWGGGAGKTYCCSVELLIDLLLCTDSAPQLKVRFRISKYMRLVRSRPQDFCILF